MQPHFLEILFINTYELFHTAHHCGIEKVSVQSEALTRRVVERWQFGAKAIKSHLIVVIEVLEHTDNLTHSFNIFIGYFINELLSLWRVCKSKFSSFVG
jgi:hypothetical protein